MRPALLPVTVEVLDDTSASLTIGKEKYKLSLGVWSPVIEVKFAAGFAMTIHAVTQVILTQVKDGVSLYFVPLQIHPLHSLWHYATPASLVKESWNVTGGFLTLGWPQDTNGLEEGCISDQQFLDLCDLIFASRKKIFFHQLSKFREGVLAGIFDCLDRVQHMFMRTNPEIVEQWYLKLDAFVGRSSPPSISSAWRNIASWCSPTMASALRSEGPSQSLADAATDI